MRSAKNHLKLFRPIYGPWEWQQGNSFSLTIDAFILKKAECAKKWNIAFKIQAQQIYHFVDIAKMHR